MFFFYKENSIYKPNSYKTNPLLQPTSLFSLKKIVLANRDKEEFWRSADDKEWPEFVKDYATKFASRCT